MPCRLLSRIFAVESLWPQPQARDISNHATSRQRLRRLDQALMQSAQPSIFAMEFAGQQHGSFHQPGAQVAGSNSNTSSSHTPHGDGDYSLLDEDRFSLFSSFFSPYSAAPAAALASPWAREFLNVGNCGSTCSEGAYTSPPASSRSSSVGDLNDSVPLFTARGGAG
eukprot:TRINITY_DN1101_c0_g2_i2.p3 TRINITY_DN1101_c0_g2~~TRINITY_DN1101_c0_g2_i2.p3  ORF type:complete len:167 (-),score=12.72 TRINITY_DN1101_c0_g2_i2:308-808(-)